MNIGAQLSAQRKQYDKVCPSCNEHFNGIKIAVFCSNRCRQKAKYIRNKITTPKVINREVALSKELGLSSPYDWSNINIATDVFILRVLEGCNVRDITRCAMYFGIERVGAVIVRITDTVTLQIVERQYSNISKVFNGS